MNVWYGVACDLSPIERQGLGVYHGPKIQREVIY